MGNNIGYHFVKQLPTELTSEDNFAFYFVKPTTSEPVEVYLGRKKEISGVTSSEFHKITKDLNYYPKTINQKNPDTNGNIQLSLSDLGIGDLNLRYFKQSIFAGNIIPEKLSNNSGNNIALYYKQIKFADNSVFYQNVLIGEGLKLSDTNITTVKNNVWINSNYEIPKETTEISDNVYIGGFYDSTPTTNELKNNIHIKNLGEGNLTTEFKFFTKLKISDNTELKSTTNPLGEQFGNVGLLVTNQNNQVHKLDPTYFKQIFFSVGNDAKESQVNIYASENENKLLICANKPTNIGNFTSKHSGNYFLTAAINDETINSTSLGDNNISIGKNDVSFNNNNVVVGHITNNYRTNFNESVIIGNKLFNSSDRTTFTNNSIIIGNNILNEVTDKISFTKTILIGNIFGSVIPNNDQNKTVSNSIVIGNCQIANYKINNKFIVASNLINQSTPPPFEIEFKDVLDATTKDNININTSVKFKLSELKYIKLDVTQNKIVTLNSDGILGYMDLSDLSVETASGSSFE